MGTYTPPDIPDELYNFLKPSDALMLRGLVAKFNKEMSNCVRVVAARPELVPSVEEIFQQNLHKNLTQAPVISEKLDGANIVTTSESAQIRAAAHESAEVIRSEIRAAANRADLDDVRANHPAPSAADNIYTLVVKFVLRDGRLSMSQLLEKANTLKPETTKGSVAAAVWRLSKQQNILAKVGTGSRQPLYDLGDGFWANVSKWR